MNDKELFQITMHLHAESELALKVSFNGEKDLAMWIPKSILAESDIHHVAKGLVKLTMPEWIAVKRGLA